MISAAITAGAGKLPIGTTDQKVGGSTPSERAKPDHHKERTQGCGRKRIVRRIATHGATRWRGKGGRTVSKPSEANWNGDEELSRDLAAKQFDILFTRLTAAKTRRFQVVRETIALIAAVYVGIFLVKPATVPLSVFMLVFACGVPALALIGFLTWIGEALEHQIHRVEIMLLEQDYPDAVWPNQTHDYRRGEPQRLPGLKDKWHAYGALLAFPGLAVGSIVLAVARAQGWRPSVKAPLSSWTWGVWLSLAGGVAVAMGVLALIAAYYRQEDRLRKVLYEEPSATPPTQGS
jgi:hypothetical protein